MPNIQLYGNNHSPWVQAVMMGLHQKQMEYSRTATPPFEVFKPVSYTHLTLPTICSV